MGFDFDALRDSVDRLARPECASCGGTEWASEDIAVLLQHVDPDQPVAAGVGYPVLTLICDHCGFVRMHSISHL
jgi:hypothetical protein